MTVSRDNVFQGPLELEPYDARLKALREAARVGIADIEAGRYRTFDSPTKLRRHLQTLIHKVLARKRRRS